MTQTNPSELTIVNENVGVGVTRFPKMEEQVARLQKAGLDPTDPQYWVPNALLVASDIFELNVAKQASESAIMLLASVLSHKPGAAQDLNIRLHHTSGLREARLSLRFNAKTPMPKVPTEILKDKVSWIEKTSLPAEEVKALVETFAAATDTRPGQLPSILGLGATLAMLEVLQAMNAQRYGVEIQGLGDGKHSNDLKALINLHDPRNPQPQATKKAPRRKR